MNKITLPIALFIPALAFAAGESVDQSKATGAQPKVVLENVRGKITIKGWDKNEAKIVGQLDEQTDRFIFDSDDEQVRIIIDAPLKGDNWGPNNGQGTNLTIHLPTNASIDADGFATDFSVSDVHGEVELVTVSGDLRVNSCTSRVDLESVSGDMRISEHRGAAFAESVSGDIDYVGTATRLELQSVQGDINVNNQGSLDEGEFNSVSGDIDTRTHTGDKANLEYNAISGDIDISFLNSINAKIRVETMSGDITNSLTDDPVNQQRWVGSSLEYTLGNGDGDIRVSTVNGNINIE